MTVAELIERLQECDPDAEVRIMTQESWPFENAISGIAVRAEFGDDESCECYQEPHDPDRPAVAGYDDGLLANDVFIVEGRQERYGSKRAWEVAC